MCASLTFSSPLALGRTLTGTAFLLARTDEKRVCLTRRPGSTGARPYRRSQRLSSPLALGAFGSSLLPRSVRRKACLTSLVVQRGPALPYRRSRSAVLISPLALGRALSSSLLPRSVRRKACLTSLVVQRGPALPYRRSRSAVLISPL